MKPGQQTADLIFEKVCNATAFAHAVARDADESELRNALAALSTFKGPGIVARDAVISIIRDELSTRGAC